MKNAFIKNTFREIRKSKNRFLSVFAISLIGVAFFSGIKAAGPDMLFSSDIFYDESNLMDLRVVSTLGLTDDDVKTLESIDGVSGVSASFYKDAVASIGERETVTRIFSYNLESDINKLVITEGRLPEAPNECIIDSNPLQSSNKIGDKLMLNSGSKSDELSDSLENIEYVVVGMFKTPMYISGTQRGSTTVGNGTINMLMYVPEENFKAECYTEIYLTFNNLKPLSSYKSEYITTRDEWVSLLKSIGETRSDERKNEILEEPLKELEDAEKELSEGKAEGEKKLAEAEKKLADAKKQLDDAEKELSDGRAKIEDGKIQLADGEKKLSEARQKLSDAEKQLSEAKLEIEKGEKELSDAKAQLDDGKIQLDEGKQTLADSKIKIENGRAEFEKSKAEFEKQISEGEEKLKSSRNDYENGEIQYQDGLSQYNAGLSEWEAGKSILDEAKTQLDLAIEAYGKDNPTVSAQIEEYNKNKAELDISKQTLDQTKAVLDETRATLDSAKAQLEQGEKTLKIQKTLGQKQLDSAEKMLLDGEKQYKDGLTLYNEKLAEYNAGLEAYLRGYEKFQNGKADYEKGLEDYNDGLMTYKDGQTEFNIKKAELFDAEKKISEGEKEYQDGLSEYNDGLSEFNESKLKFETEIADAEEKISDGRKEIEKIGDAKWYVFTRDDNPAYTEYGQNADRIQNIGHLFPVFFIIVAALVCLTTMTRMVEENRTQIGTMKSLGYKDGSIMAHYMFYAMTATFFGSVGGLIIGPILFPTVIFYAYGMMYQIPELFMPFQLDLVVSSILIMLICIGLTVFFSCKAELSQRPSQLMRPKSPKSGKRIFLEKFTHLWSKMSFFHKVSARNLFLYKRRMLMTTIGIAGCTALTVTGFGLRDSISDIVGKQFNELYSYSGIVAVSDIDDEEFSEIESIMSDFDENMLHNRVYQKKFDMTNDGNKVSASVVVTDGELSDYIVFRERISKKSIELKDDGAIITEKLAKLLNVKAGDEISVEISETEKVNVKISTITEHYASHYIYLTKDYYSKIFEKSPEYNMLYIKSDLLGDEGIDVLSENLLQNKNVLMVSMVSKMGTTFNDMLDMLDLVIIVLIVSAGALAFVVLYNLTNINITERIREIATLKVLGFYDREVSGYVFRENIILTVLGAIAGLVLGVFLCGIVIQTAEIDEVMFGRDISFMSFVLSFAVTLVFAVVVNLYMHFHLKKVSMVESLKSVE